MRSSVTMSKHPVRVVHDKADDYLVKIPLVTRRAFSYIVIIIRKTLCDLNLSLTPRLRCSFLISFMRYFYLMFNINASYTKCLRRTNNSLSNRRKSNQYHRKRCERKLILFSFFIGKVSDTEFPPLIFLQWRKREKRSEGKKFFFSSFALQMLNAHLHPLSSDHLYTSDNNNVPFFMSDIL